MIELPNVTALYVLLAFGASCWILRKYLFAPLGGILDAREQSEKAARESYAESLLRLEKAVAAGEEKLAEARREALKIRSIRISRSVGVVTWAFEVRERVVGVMGCRRCARGRPRDG